MTINKYLCFFIFKAGLILFCLGSVNAYSESRKIHSGECHTITDNEGVDIYKNSSFQNRSDIFHESVYCNIPTDGSLHFYDLNRLNIQGYIPDNEYTTSKACYFNLETRTYSCGATKTWGEGYQGAPDVDVTVWKNHRNNIYKFVTMPYIYTSLAPGGRIYGYYIRD